MGNQRVLIVSAASLLLACGTEPGPTEPLPPPPPPPTPSTFELEVAVRTEGVNLDPDGYTISIDSVPRTVARQDTLKVPGLAAGPHTVAISGLTMNCRIPLDPASDIPKPQDEAWVVERLVYTNDGPLHVEFVIQCYEVGTLDLVVLGGSENGPTRFFVTMSHDPRMISVRRGVRYRLESVSAGEHTAWVRALCGFDLGRPTVARINVAAGLIAHDTITARSQPCAP